MEGASDPRRKAFERDVKRRFRRGETIAVAADLRARFGLPAWEAWRAAAALMREHGKEPTAAALGRVVEALGRPRAVTKDAHVALYYAYLSALAKWSMGRVGLEHRLALATTSRDLVKRLAAEPTEEAALAGAVVAALERLAERGSYGRFVVSYARSMVAVALLKSAPVDRREAGRELLEAQMAEMEVLLASPLEFAGAPGVDRAERGLCEYLHGMVVNNVAEAWVRRVEGYPEGNLRRAVDLYEKCSAMPGRRADPDKHVYSLHHLALALRKLARRVADLRERGALLKRSAEAADRGLAIVAANPGLSLEMGEALKLNRANTEVRLLLHSKATGELPADVVDARLREACRAALTWLERSPIRNRPEAVTGRGFFLLHGGDAPTAEIEEGALAGILAVSRGIFARGQRNGLSFMTAEEAENARISLAYLVRDGISPRLLEPEAAQCLPVLMGALHPLNTGLEIARELYAIELPWLAHLLPRLGPLGPKYIEDALRGMHRWMCEPDLPAAHRRIFASQIRRLAELVLDRKAGLPDLDPVARLRFHDLAGAAFYRAETTFYGQGVTSEAKDGSEPGWRMGLYRARVEMDACATLHVYEGNRSLLEASRPAEAVRDFFETLQTYRSQGPAGGEIGRLGPAIEEIAKLRKEINVRRVQGLEQHWSPSSVELTPAPELGEIKEWLQARPSTGVLAAGPQMLGIVRVVGGEAELLALDSLAGDGFAALLDDVDRLSSTWLTQLGVSGEQERAGLADLEDALRAILEEPRWAKFSRALAEALAERGLTSLVVLGRGPWRLFPWESLPVGDDATFGERLAIVHLPTLSAVGTKPAPLREGILAYVGAASGSSTLDIGRAGFAACGVEARGPLGREVFEEACAGAGVVRVFAHGAFSQVDAPRSHLLLDEDAEPQLPYTAYEIMTMDLRGCGRVELWACESGVQMDHLGLLLGNDEPLGIAASFLLAGARVIIGSIWKQPAWVAGLVAVAFAARAGSPGSALRDAEVLAAAVAASRRALDEDGVFVGALRDSIQAQLTAAPAGGGIVAEAMRVAWKAAVVAVGGGGEVELPWSVVEGESDDDAHDLAEVREALSDPVELDFELRRFARRLSEPLRHESASAGWRVLGRDKSVL